MITPLILCFFQGSSIDALLERNTSWREAIGNYEARIDVYSNYDSAPIRSGALTPVHIALSEDIEQGVKLVTVQVKLPSGRTGEILAWSIGGERNVIYRGLGQSMQTPRVLEIGNSGFVPLAASRLDIKALSDSARMVRLTTWDDFVDLVIEPSPEVLRRIEREITANGITDKPQELFLSRPRTVGLRFDNSGRLRAVLISAGVVTEMPRDTAEVFQLRCPCALLTFEYQRESMNPAECRERLHDKIRDAQRLPTRRGTWKDILLGMLLGPHSGTWLLTGASLAGLTLVARYCYRLSAVRRSSTADLLALPGQGGHQ